MSKDDIQTVDQVIRAHVLGVLKRFDWNMVQSSNALGIDRRRLYRWLNRWGVNLKIERARQTLAAETEYAPARRED